MLQFCWISVKTRIPSDAPQLCFKMKRNTRSLLLILVGSDVSHPSITFLTSSDWFLFLACASQEGCLWRSSLKVPRVTPPLSDCCSQIKEPLVSSEDTDIDRNTVSQSQSSSLSRHLTVLSTLRVCMFTWMDTSFINMAPPLWTSMCLH